MTHLNLTREGGSFVTSLKREGNRSRNLSRNCLWDSYLGRAGQLLANRFFAASNSRGTKPPCWRAKVALGQDKQKEHIILNGNFLCLSCPSAPFALKHGGFVPRKWLAAKGLFLSVSSNTPRSLCES